MLIPLKDLIRKYRFHPKGVVHIGANTGQEADDYLKENIHSSFWVEAIPDVFKKLQQHLSKKNFLQCTISNTLLSNVDGKEVTFHIASNDGQSSSMFEFGTHTKEHPTVKFTHDITLTTKRFDTLVREILANDNPLEIKMNEYDFLNIDVQGAELLVMEGMGNLIKKFKWIYLEVNEKELYKGIPLIDEIDTFLYKKGFERKETNMTNFGWGDAFYIKF